MKERALQALARAEKQRQQALQTAQRCQLAAQHLEAKCLKERNRLAGLVDDQDPEKRRAARTAYLKAAQNRARAAQAYRLAEEQARRLQS